jgi:hypothetical protein
MWQGIYCMAGVIDTRQEKETQWHGQGSGVSDTVCSVGTVRAKRVGTANTKIKSGVVGNIRAVRRVGREGLMIVGDILAGMEVLSNWNNDIRGMG